MGTRGAIGFRSGGQDKISYNHWDSYPDGLGRKMLEYCGTHSLDQMRSVASKIVLVSDGEHPTPKQTEDHLDSLNTDVGQQSVEDLYCLLREAQGDLAYYDDPKHYLMVDNSSFLADSLFCEWAYVVNLDEGVLECYRGFNKDPDAPGRYARLSRDDYQGVALSKAYPLAVLPDGDAFVAELDPETDETEPEAAE